MPAHLSSNIHAKARREARRLGGVSLALGLPAALAPDVVARLTGVDDSTSARGLVRLVGIRELGHAATLWAGPPGLVWGRVAGDALDLTLLGRALTERQGRRRTRVAVTMAAVLGVTFLDIRAARSARRAGQHGRGRPGPLELQASITVNLTPEEAYDAWADLTRLPDFMRHLESVTVSPDGRTSRWTATGPLGKKVTWQAELTSAERGTRLAWRSLPGADVDNSGTVHFSPAPGDRGTEVRVVLHYDVPGGAIGRAVATMLGEEPDQQVRDDLRRFKQTVETGEPVRSDGLPDGTDARHQVVQRPARPRAGEGVR